MPDTRRSSLSPRRRFALVALSLAAACASRQSPDPAPQARSAAERLDATSLAAALAEDAQAPLAGPSDGDAGTVPSDAALALAGDAVV
jgi:hypothetical protein